MYYETKDKIPFSIMDVLLGEPSTVVKNEDKRCLFISFLCSIKLSMFTLIANSSSIVHEIKTYKKEFSKPKPKK
jgi:hypothetical protein